MMMCWKHILAAVERHGTCALVTMLEVEGSAPREQGARMVVAPDGILGTIGGGTLEWKALAAAQAMLGKSLATKLTSHILGPDLGQCCGGRVQLLIENFDLTSLSQLRELASRETDGPQFITGRNPALPQVTEQVGMRRRQVNIYGAGHVGRALVQALAELPFAVQWVDSRANAFPQVVPDNVTLHKENPLFASTRAPSGSLAFVMTHSHALDFDLCDQLLRDPHFAHVGLIGSTTKRARFESRLLAAGIQLERVKSLICPIGLPGIVSKLPASIAISTAAQILTFDEALQSCNSEFKESGAPAKIGTKTAGERV